MWIDEVRGGVTPSSRIGRRLLGALAGALIACCGAARAADYYVSPSGNDANAGTSQASAWRTLARVNSQAFAAGDRILLEGGQAFSGGLYFDAADAGTAASPIVVSSYGAGRATIRPTTTDGIYAYNTAGLLISQLVIEGPGAATSTKLGIGFYADLPGDVKLDFVHVDSVTVSGFRAGISIGSWAGTTGYRDVSVVNTDAHANLEHGMIVFGAARGANLDVVVSRCRFFDNLGNPRATTPTGNGVVLGQVDGARIERCVAWNNGGSGAPGLGPVAIWAYDSNAVTIEHCEAYGNHAAVNVDGGGFDLDIGMTNSVMQYNYAHDNDGAGFGFYQGVGSSTWAGNVVRYNVSENDGRKNGYGAFTVWSNGDPMSDCDIYGNTIFVSPSATGTPRAIRFNSPSTRFRFFNNLVVTTGGLPLIDVVAGQTGMVFQGNDYWTSGGAFAILWQGTTHGSLGAWSSATGQELDGATLVGLNVDPLLTAPGTGGTIGNADNLAGLSAYRLQASSPVIDAGLDLAGRFVIDPGPHDFYDIALPQGRALDIGAHETTTVVVPGPPGHVPNGTTSRPGAPLRVIQAGAALVLTWSASCSADATDYAVHEGSIGAWYSHASLACSTGGSLGATVSPSPGDRYYLVVPMTATEEGSYGVDSNGVERPASSGAPPCRAAQRLGCS